MRPNTDESPAQQRLTVPEAARALGLTSEAVRSRVRRGTLSSERTEDGTLYVLVKPTDSDASSGASTDASGDQALLIERLDSEIEFLRAELARRDETFKYREETFRKLEEAWREESRRKDHILAALTQRIPELTAPREERESTPADSQNTTEGEVPSEPQQRSWWQRMFGG